MSKGFSTAFICRRDVWGRYNSKKGDMFIDRHPIKPRFRLEYW